MSILEAVCDGCGETFVPNDEADTTHGEKENGEPCGAMGRITGEYFAPGETVTPDHC